MLGRRKTVAIVQSNYIPWKGYFDIINRVDEFIILDDVQYTRRDWRNRNQIKTQNGKAWLTVPVQTKGRYHARIDEIEVSTPWAEEHFKSIRSAYANAKNVDEVLPILFAWYERAANLSRLTEINEYLIRSVAAQLGIKTRITRSSAYASSGQKSEKLVALCLAADADCYLSGPSAQAYLDESLFAESGLTVEWMSYGPYPEYAQPHGSFDHNVSIVDLLVCTGVSAQEFCESLHLPTPDK